MFKYFVIILSLNLNIVQRINSQHIKIHYLGHSAFVLQFDDKAVVTDYGKPNAWKEWGWDSPILNIGDLVPDIMTYSHLHDDHYDSTRIAKGVKYILKNRESMEFDDLKITGIPTCEDQFDEFNNTSYIFSYKGYNIVHTGDIQNMIANIENDAIANYFRNNFPEKIDLLIMPIEGKVKYIQQAEQFIRLIKPKQVIPAHYWSKGYLDEFIGYLKEKNKIDDLYIFRRRKILEINRYKFNNSKSIIIVQMERLPLN